MGSANVEVVSRCLPPQAIGLERLAQGRTYKLINVLYSHVFPRPGCTYLLFDLICLQSGRIMIALMSYPGGTPGLDSATYCVVANLCTTVSLHPNAESPTASWYIFVCP